MISIIIVNYNLSKEILDCLTSLYEHVKQSKYEVIIVDNASNDQDKGQLLQFVGEKSNAFYVLLSANVGFGAACNKGVEQARGHQFCFLNPDTIINNDFLACLSSALMSNKLISAVGPQINQPKWINFSAGQLPTLWLEFLSIFYIGRYVEAFIMAIRANFSRGKIVDVGWVLGACIMVKQEAFHKISGFDENFFLFYEEVDLCKRMINQGGKITYVKNCQIQHIGSVSVSRDYASFTKHFYQSKLYYLEKHYGGLTRVLFYFLLRIQVATQQSMWFVLQLIYPHKAKQKLKGFGAIKFDRRGV